MPKTSATHNQDLMAQNYEGAVETYRQALRDALKPEEAEAAIEALGELLSVAKMIGTEEARETVP